MKTTRRNGAITTLVGVCLGLQISETSPCRANDWLHPFKRTYTSTTVTVTKTRTRGVAPQIAPAATVQPVAVPFYQPTVQPVPMAYYPAPVAPTHYIHFMMPVASVAMPYAYQPQPAMPVAPYVPTFSAPAPVAPAPIAPMPVPQAPPSFATPQR